MGAVAGAVVAGSRYPVANTGSLKARFLPTT